MIIFDRGSQFAARFWEQLHVSLGTHLIHRSAYHPQTDGQTERVNQILEDMLRACMMEYPGSWNKNLPWAEFSYNSNYQESLKWHHSRHLMDDNATPHSIGSSQERKLYLAQTLLLRPKQRYVVYKKI
jgi:hypothetical protein